MGKTTLMNNVGFNVKVREGNAGIFRDLQLLKNGTSMTIKADNTATYREYVLIVLPDNKKLRPLTSDDIQELPAVEIFKDEDGEFDWRPFQGGGAKEPGSAKEPGVAKKPGFAKKSWFVSVADSIVGVFSRKSGVKLNAEAGGKADNEVADKAGSSKPPTSTQSQ